MLNFKLKIKKIVSFFIVCNLIAGSASAYFSLLEYETACNILGISINSSESEIKKAYREKIKIVHPDRGGQHEAFCKIDDSYRFLIHLCNKSSHGFDVEPKKLNNSSISVRSAPKPKNYKDFKYLFSGAFCYGLYKYMKSTDKIGQVKKTHLVDSVDFIEPVEQKSVSFFDFDSAKKYLQKHPYVAATGAVALAAAVAYGCYKLYGKVDTYLKNLKNSENKEQNIK